MGIQQIKQIVDDRDGRELPSNTAPVALTYRGKAYDLYLSKENASELDKLIAEFTANAQAATAGETEKYARYNGHKPSVVREWLIDQGLREEGTKGPFKHVDKFRAAHPRK